jgi:EAL domain-containing protein (putative c-di-GMP-specific phosphodiesterase class I)
VEAVVKVAHALGKQVIAEGVETEEVAAELHRLGIEYGQGFLSAPPSAHRIVRADDLLAAGD